ncbi:hypothetical protein WR25_03939 isoform D [Diploscapter pachys]|uniref:Core-2/I-Branching enzyme n=1 Tax=Diploscapter pachys TaxID=2018661 RepID=A0A2A2LX32_9BILA|nr:hypothetical protein WR25_03939 isoform C [Diploscapter pachys]PAV90545.1 hypothetical protein WR25_03939 isoform D [Diploscapter pachys]
MCILTCKMRMNRIRATNFVLTFLTCQLIEYFKIIWISSGISGAHTWEGFLVSCRYFQLNMRIFIRIWVPLVAYGIIIYLLYTYFSYEKALMIKQPLRFSWINYSSGIAIRKKNIRSGISKSITATNTYNEKDLLDSININCQDIITNKPDPTIEIRYKSWRYNFDEWENKLINSEDRCSTIKVLFRFDTEPRSIEEAKYPLAYGLVVYKDIIQLLFMISSIYAPQNEYCIAVSGSSNELFKILMADFEKCFKNVHVLNRPPISWGSFEIINSTYACLDYLAKLSTPWKYYQYLSGFDAPLKTNYEMVQIFKAMKGAWNVEIKNFQPERLNGDIRNTTPPLNIYKSSLSSLVPRSAANMIVNSPMTRQLFEYLSHSYIPDEAFWATLAANRKSLCIRYCLKIKNDYFPIYVIRLKLHFKMHYIQKHANMR